MVARLPLEGELLSQQQNISVSIPVTEKDFNRWLVVVENGRATVKNIDNKSCIDTADYNKLRKDMRYAQAVLSELAKRTRLVNGECSVSVFDQSLEQKLSH